MTDPITQDQNQNVQNVQNPQISQTETPVIDFDLNLPTSEETSSTEEPVVSLDFSDLGTIETTQNETQQPKIEETPAIVEENQPKAEELQQNIINSIDNISLGQSPSTTQPVEEIIQKDVVVNLPTEQANDSETIQTEQTNKVSSEVIKTQPEIIETTPETIQPGEEINEVNSEVIEVQPETTEVQPEATTETQPEATTETQPEATTETQPEATEVQPEATTETQPEATETQPEATTNPIDEITTELPPVPVEEVMQQPEAKDNRLDQEDALVAQEKQPSEETPVITTKEIPEIKTEALNIFEEPSNSQEDMLQENTNENTASAIVTESNEEIQNEQQPIPTESNSETFSKPETSENISTIQNNEQEKPAPGQPEQNFPPSANLEQDQMIIQQLQASAGKTTEVVPVPTTPAATEVNLDDLLNSPAPQQTNDIQNPTINIPNNPTLNTQNTTQIPNPAQNTLPAFTGVQGFSLPPITQQLAQQAKQPLNKKILINFGIGIIALVVGGFMFKTMYPLEYQKLMGKSENTASIENTLATTSWTIDETTEADYVAPGEGLFENPALANYHSAAGENSWTMENDFNAFEDIESTMEEDMTKTKEQLQNYIDQGKKYIVIGKKTNDKNSTKYGLFLYKKASALLVDIENGNQISTDEITSQLADFETYLQKLTGTGSHDETTLQQPTTPTPEEFFWSENSWTTEPEPTPTEIPTTTESWTNTEETKTPVENLSWDENSILQPNEPNW